MVIALAATLAGTAALARTDPARGLEPPAAVTRVARSAPHARRAAEPSVPAALFDPAIGLRAPPVGVPLELQIPTIGINATIIGVGVTDKNAMDAPEGPAGNAVWQQAYWFRGSAIPGQRSTALIAGHIDGPHGSAALFGRIQELKPGDPILVHDTRNGLNVLFSVTGAQTFSLDQTLDPAVLNQIYGVGPVAGTVPQRSADGLSHLTLITCAGTFTNGTHDHRLAVFADRVS